jgi:TorA maturation chaperone TorD
MPTPSEPALVRSAVYQALALGFSPPDALVRERLASEEGAAMFRAALAAAGTPVDFAPGCDRLEDRHADLFGHTARGRVSPYETEYGPSDLFAQPRDLADIGALLAAFGLVVDASRHERSDHVRVECELMAFLARKEAWAIEGGDEATLGEIRKAERLFLRDHLGRFVPALAAQLARHDPGGFYGALGSALGRFVEAECARFDVHAGPPTLRVSLPVADDVPMACGSCEAAPE